MTIGRLEIWRSNFDVGVMRGRCGCATVSIGWVRITWTSRDCAGAKVSARRVVAARFLWRWK